jgi:hypothetical protein
LVIYSRHSTRLSAGLPLVFIPPFNLTLFPCCLFTIALHNLT